MNFTLKDLIEAAIDTVRSPKTGARRIMAINMPRRQRWEFLLLIVIASIILAELTLILGGGNAEDFLGGSAIGNPIILGAVQLFFLFMLVRGVHFIGKMAGGTGTLDDVILLVVWLQFILICLQVVQTIAFVVFPLLAAMIGLASVGLFFMLLTHFVAEVHGFKSLGRVFFAILVSLVGFAIFLSFPLSLLGIRITG